MQQKRFGVRLKENNITKNCIATTGARKKNYAIRCSRNLIVCCCFYFFLSKRITSTKNDKCTHVSTRRIIISRFHWCNRCRRVQFVSFFFIIIIIVIIFHLNFFPSQSVNAIQSRGECRECTKKNRRHFSNDLWNQCAMRVEKKTAKIIFAVAIWFLSIHLWYAQPSFGVDCCCCSALVNMQKQFVFQSCMTRKQIAPR